MHTYLKEIQSQDFSQYKEVMVVGELPYTPNVNEILYYVSARGKELNMVFHFDIVYPGTGIVLKYMPEPFTLLSLYYRLIYHIYMRLELLSRVLKLLVILFDNV